MEHKKNLSLAVMLGGIHSSYPRNLLRGISQKAKEEKVNMFFFLRIPTRPFLRGILGDVSSNQFDYQFNTVFDYSRISGADGIVLGYGTIGMHLKKNNQKEFIGRYNHVPVIVIPDYIEMPNCSSIISDNRQGMRDMTSHLIEEHGCRKILFMRGPQNNTDSEERLQGYMDAMAAHGLEVEPGMIGQGDFSGYVDEEVRRMLTAYPDAEAFMFSNDEMARSCYRVCSTMGIRVGTDLKVTGFDSADFTEKMTPPLTTVYQDAYGMGVRCVENIFRAFDGEQIREDRFPTSLIIRESCGCKAEKNTLNAEKIDYEAEYKRFRSEAAAKEREFQEFQGKSWYIPMIARDLNDCVEDDQVFCAMVMEKLKALNTKNAYLFLTEEPISYDGVSDWNCPENLRLASFMRNGEITSYPSGERPDVSREKGMAYFTEDGESHQFMVYLLFSGEKQYGLMLCEVPLEELSFFHFVSLQIGLSMRYFEISKLEAMRRSEMTHDMELMRQKNEELGVLSSYDELTQLLNRRGLKDRIKEICQDSAYPNAFVVYCDMDHLKVINDTWGHLEGNCAIRACGEILQGCIRGTDILARLGGDEFVCLITQADETFPQEFQNRLEQACERWNRESGKPYRVEISVGVVPLSLQDYGDFQRASGEADQLMYKYKKARRKSRSKKGTVSV